MLLTTQGLVLHTTKYAETSIIAKVFTRELGCCSYIVKGVRSARSRAKQNLMQPLSHLEMTVYNNPKKQLQYIKEMRLATPIGSLSTDGVRMALLFFMDEVLYKALKDNEPNPALFDYVVDELQLLQDSQQTAAASESVTMRSNAHFPIRFLLRTAHFLGIEPMDNYSSREPLFNLKEGRFLSTPTPTAVAADPDADYFLDPHASIQIHSCLSSTRHNGSEPSLNASQRSTTLNNLIEYYHVHLSDFKNFKSHEVLHAVLR